MCGVSSPALNDIHDARPPGDCLLAGCDSSITTTAALTAWLVRRSDCRRCRVPGRHAAPPLTPDYQRGDGERCNSSHLISYPTPPRSLFPERGQKERTISRTISRIISRTTRLIHSAMSRQPLLPRSSADSLDELQPTAQGGTDAAGGGGGGLRGSRRDADSQSMRRALARNSFAGRSAFALQVRRVTGYRGPAMLRLLSLC